jgi:hypothetical protein
MADSRQAAQLEMRRDIEARIARLEERLGQRESDSAGELPDVDQHPGELGSELYDRQQDIQRLETLQEQLRALDDAAARPDAPPVPPGERLAARPDADDATPLDEPAPRPPDLGAIPMGRDESVDKDPQDLDAPGMLSHEGANAPDVGDPDPDAAPDERRYRPRR